MAQRKSRHMDGQNVAELRNFKLNPLAADPGAPVEGVVWTNTTDKRLKQFDGTSTQSVAWLSDITGISRYRGAWDASTGIPTAAGSALYTGDAIEAGDFWRVSVGGTIAGIGGSGVAAIQAGDVIFANSDAAATAAEFFVGEGNLAIGTQMAQESIALASLPASTATNVDPVVLNGGSIASWKIVDNTGNDLTDSFDVVLSQATPRITITSLTAETNLTVVFSGTP